MKIYSPEYIIDYARKHSPYYAGLYKKASKNPALTDLPLIDQTHFWANASMKGGSVLTARQVDGQVLKSGGTTGAPKYAPYTSEEWDTMCRINGFYLSKSGLKNGDRIANLFYSGGMYGSFIYVYSLLREALSRTLLFNIGGQSPIEEMVSAIVNMEINVLAGIPSIILKIIEYVEKNKVENFNVDVIYFAGETLYPDQRESICSILGRKVDFRSVSLAGNDYGLVGYFSSDCGFNEHRVCDTACIFELIDPDTNEVITEENRIGKIYITSLYKLLMPLIRYPIGDMGMYTEPKGMPDRKFKLLGRSEEAARIGVVSMYVTDVSRILHDLGITVNGYQLIVSHTNKLDQLTIKISPRELNGKNKEDILKALFKERPLFLDSLDKGIISPVEITFCRMEDLEFNHRTGKLKSLIDLRF